MKTGQTVEGLSKTILDQIESKADYLVPSNKLKFNANGVRSLGWHGSEGSMDGHGMERDYPLGDIAEGQLREWCGIPNVYWKKLQGSEDSKSLMVANVQHWLDFNPPRRRMIRTLDGKARAFLSDRYRRLDNADVADVVLGALQQLPDVKVESCQITESNLYLKCRHTGIEGEVYKGRTINPMVIIRNSEVGQGAFSVAPGWFDQWCKNGAFHFHETERQAHLQGSRDAHLDGLLSQEAKNADDHAILLKMRDVTLGAFSQEAFEKRLVQLREGRTREVEELNGAVEKLASTFSLTDGEKHSVLKRFARDADISQYGLGAAVTREAEEVQSYDRATELEGIGGAVQLLSARDFEPIRKAVTAA